METIIHRIEKISVGDIHEIKGHKHYVRTISVLDNKGQEIELTLFSEHKENLKIEKEKPKEEGVKK